MYRNKTFNPQKGNDRIRGSFFYHDVSDWKTGISDDLLLRILWK